MKIAFTNNGNSYTLESIKDFAKDLNKRFETTQKPGQIQFVADFALLDMMADNIEISSFDDMVGHASCWHGVKELGEIGFNDDEYRHLIFDYYGGGSMFIVNHSAEWSDEEETFNNIDKTLTDIFDVTSDEWVLLVQWTEDKCLVEDRESGQTDTTKKIEDDAVRNFAEMLESKIEGAIGAGYDGIGKEDLDDALYEYLNWDKKYTAEYEANKPNNVVLTDKSESQPQDDKKYYIDIFRLEEATDIVVESNWMTEEDARRWFQSTINFVQYGNYGVRLMHAVGDNDCYDVEVVENLY